MDPTHPSAPDRRRWVKTAETGLLVVASVVICLLAALGLVAVGATVLFAYAMSNFGSNK